MDKLQALNSAKGRGPKYVQIEEEIKHKILSKEWPDGCQIPIEAEFCEMYNVSRITVRKALENLQASGYLIKIQGKGTFVNCPPMEQRLSKFYSFGEELRRRGHNEEAVLLEFSKNSADSEIARHLGLREGDQVFRITRLRKTETGPYALETSFIPAKGALVDLLPAQVNQNGLYKTLASYGVRVDSAQETFKAINVNKEQSKWLNVRIDAAAISLTRTSYCNSEIAEYCISVVRGDFFSYTVDLN